MKLIIHDLNLGASQRLFGQNPENTMVIGNDHEIHNCTGCFGCWIETPSVCVIKDHYRDMGRLISQSEEVQIISRCYYGGFNPFVKNVLDRSISYIHPYFIIRNDEMHHKSRYTNRFKLAVVFYGEDLTENEKSTAEKLVKANGLNLNTLTNSVSFYNNVQDMEEALK